MVAGGESIDAIEAARGALAARDADLAEADRVLIAAVADTHAVAVDSIGRIATIESDIESAAAGQQNDTAAGARELSRQLVARNRDIADIIRDARAAAHAKTVALQELSEHYRPPAAL